MSDLAQALQHRHLWVICRDTPADDDILLGDADTAIRPAPRPTYDRVRKRLPDTGQAAGVQWYVSPARRAHQTASRLVPEARWEAQEHVGPRLWGHWQGLDWPTIRSRDALRVEAFWSDYGQARPPEGESLADVIERWHLFATALTHQADWKQAVVVTHPDVIRAAVCHVLDLKPANASRIAVHPLSITRLSASFVGWKLDELNVHPA